MKWLILSLIVLALTVGVLLILRSRGPQPVSTFAANVRTVPVAWTSIGAGSAVDAKGRMLLCGEMGALGNPSVTITVVDATLRPLSLVPTGTAPVGIVVPSVAVVPETSTLFVFGGWPSGGALPSDQLAFVDLSAAVPAWSYVPRAAPWPPARNGAGMIYDRAGHRLVLLLGDSALDAQGMFHPLGDVWQFDLVTRTWSELSPRGSGPSARWHAMAAMVDDSRRLYVIGGAEVSGFDRALYVLDLATDSWRKLDVPRSGEWPPSLQGATLTHDARAGVLLLAGGLRHEPPGPATSADLWIFDLTTERWQRIDGGEKVRRRDHSAYYDAGSGSHILFGGQITQEVGNFYAQGVPTSDAAIIQLTPAGLAGATAANP